METHLVGHWPLNSVDGLVAHDVSGNNNDGTLINLTADDWVPGVVKNCLNFYNPSLVEHVLVANDSAFQMGINSFSLSFWMNFQNITIPSEHWILNVGSGANSYALSIHSFSTTTMQLYSYITDENTNSDFGRGGTNLYGLHDTWFYATIVWDRILSERRHYLNGVLDYTNSMATVTGNVNPTGTIKIGTDFNGKLDEVRLYNKALTQEEITFLYTYPSGHNYLQLTNNFMLDIWG